MCFVYRSYRFRCTCAAQRRPFDFLGTVATFLSFFFFVCTVNVSLARRTRDGQCIVPSVRDRVAQRSARVSHADQRPSVAVDLARGQLRDRESLLLNTIYVLLIYLQNIYLVLRTLVVRRNTLFFLLVLSLSTPPLPPHRSSEEKPS